MKNQTLSAAVCTLGASLAAFLLRRELYALAVDQRGLLIPFHPLEIALWALALLSVPVAWWGAGKLSAGKPAPRKPWAALPCWVLAALVLLTRSGAWGRTLPALARLQEAASWLGAAALAAEGLYLLLGRKPGFLSFGGTSLFFALRLIAGYQGWSRNPQLQDDIFAAFTCVCLTLCAYHRMALAVEPGSPRKGIFFGILGCVWGFAAGAWGQDALLWLAGGLWAFTVLAGWELGETPYPSHPKT